jgi:MtaA/CmuA family methyltransferase
MLTYKTLDSARPMSPKQRFLTALLGRQPDRLPVGNVVSVATVEQMRAVNAWFPTAHSDAETMSRLATAGHEILGYDTVMPVFSVTQEAAALGCAVDWGNRETMPTVRSHPYARVEDFVLPDGWLEAPSIQVVLEAVRRLRQRFGDRVVIVGKVMGPWTLSYHMLGMEEFLVATKLDPGRARRALEALQVVSVAFAREQIRAGADIICLADHASGGIVSPLAYRDLLLPVHKRIFAAIEAPTVLHCCGNTTDRVKYFAESGVNAFHFESQVDTAFAVAEAHGRMTLVGNINNINVLLNGSRKDVLRACRVAIEGGVHILAPECAVPLNVPTENLQALVLAARGEG